MLTTSEVFDEAALTALVAAATVLGADLKAGLYTNSIAPSKVLTIGDMVEPTYAGYARQLVVMATPFRDPQNGIAALAAGLTWKMSDALVPTTVLGIFYTSGAGPSFMGIEPFANPIALVDAIDAFVTVLEYIQSNQNAGFTTVIR
jgi:hypothetical protein